MANSYEILLNIGGRISSSLKSSVSGAENSLGGIQKSAKNTSKTFSKLKGLIAGIGTAAVAGMSISSVLSETDAATKATAQMGAVLKSTKGAAGMTKKSLTELAESQEKLTTYNAATTEGAENMLLTFTNIHKNVFSRATIAAENMATAMGTSAKSAALTLGKALNDPTAGLSKLTKQGVTFTDAQKKQIKAMQKAGNTAGAQKLMLKELEKEFGGSAKAAGSTLTGQLTKAKNSIKGAGVTIMTALLPIVNKLMPLIVKGVQNIAKFITEHKATIEKAATAAGSVISNVFSKIVKFISKHKTEINGAIKTAYGLIKNTVNFVISHKTAVLAVIAGIGTAIAGVKIVQTVSKVMGTFNKVKKGIKDLQGAAKGAKFFSSLFGVSPQALLIIGIIAVIAALAFIIIKNWKPICKFFTGLWNGIKNAFKSAIKGIVKFIGGLKNTAFKIFNSLPGGIKKPLMAIFKGVKQIIGGIKKIFGGLIDIITGVFTGNWKKAWQGVQKVFSGIFDIIGGYVKIPLNAIIGIINLAIDGLNTLKISIPKGVPLIGGKTIGFSIPHIPQLASGGIVKHKPGGILANIGEGKYDEAVVPLKKGSAGGDMYFEYKPEINISGGGSSQAVDAALKADFERFKKLMKQYEVYMKRTRFAS